MANSSLSSAVSPLLTPFSPEWPPDEGEHIILVRGSDAREASEKKGAKRGKFRARSSEPPGIDLASSFITSLASWYIAVARRARCQKWVFRGGKKLVKKRLLKLPKKGGRKKERGGLPLPPSLQLLLASVKHALFDEKKEKGPLPICTFFSFFMRRISAERRTVGWRGGGKISGGLSRRVSGVGTW